jgi:hypothetical protein
VPAGDGAGVGGVIVASRISAGGDGVGVNTGEGSGTGAMAGGRSGVGASAGCPSQPESRMIAISAPSRSIQIVFIPEAPAPAVTELHSTPQT